MRPLARSGFNPPGNKTGGFAMEIACVAVMAALVGLTFGLIEFCDRQ